MRDRRNGSIARGSQAAAVERRLARQDRVRISTLPSKDGARLPSTDEGIQQTALRGEAMPFSDGQFIGEIRLELMIEVERSARPFQSRPRIIQERQEARLIAIRRRSVVGHHLAEYVVSLEI